MNKFKRFLSLFTAFFILLSCMPVTTAFAASSKRYAVTEVTPDMFTASEVLQAGLREVIEAYPVAFTKSGEACSKSHSDGEDNCLWFTPHQTFKKHGSSAIQCFGYANYVYETIFGEYWEHEQYFLDDGTLGSMSTGEKARSEFERLGVAFGTIMRSSSAGHSFVILDWDEDGVWLIHANYDGRRYGGCNTSVYYYPWDVFSDAYDKIAYVTIPASICDKCVYTAESFPVCTVCSHRLKINDNIYATYSVTADSPEYFLPLEDMVTEEITPAGEVITVTSIFDVNDSTFVRTSDGVYLDSVNLTFSGYLPSMELKNAVYPDSYTVSGKSFWLDGKVVSKNAVTSLTLEILNDAGEIIDSNTIAPNRLSVAIEDADDLQFSKLPVGNYTFRLTASDLAEESKVMIESPFRVISSRTIKDSYGDKIFRQYLLANIFPEGTTEKDYIDLYDEVLGGVKAMDITSLGISSLGDIHRFSALESLLASGNHILNIDLSRNTALKTADLTAQAAVVTAQYDRENSCLTAEISGKFITVSRPRELPEEVALTLPTGAEGININAVISVQADKKSLCDVTGDGIINSDDLSMLLMSYGLDTTSHEDVTFDGAVTSEDISVLLTYYGK